MKSYELEQVFNEASYPEVTFVKPSRYPHIKSSLKSPGKHLTISGASGTGKTTLVTHALRDLKIDAADVLWINGRQYLGEQTGLAVLARALQTKDTYEEVAPLLGLVKFVVIDDFHHLNPAARLDIAQSLKLWHEKKVRFIVVGIASSAAELYGADPELGIRNDPFEMGAQDAKFTRSLIELGEKALNVSFSSRLKSQIVEASNGVPSVIQVIGKTCCIEAGVEETCIDAARSIDFALSEIRESVLRVFDAKYMSKVVGIAQGKRRARAVHNTYFDIVASIARDRRSEIPTASIYQDVVGIVTDPDEKKRKTASYYNCINNLADVVAQHGLEDTIHIQKGKVISIEDPTFRFYLNLIDLDALKNRITIRTSTYPYDVAVSFAGDIRSQVEEFVRALQDQGLEVFYDFDQQAQLWGQDLRGLLGQVYSTEALFMVIFLSKSYPERDWTEFEVSMGKTAARKRTQEYLLPIVVDDGVKVIGLHDSIGHVDLRVTGIAAAADLVAEKVAHSEASQP